MRRLFAIIGGALAALLGLAAFVGWIRWRAAMPVRAGTLRVAGLERPVRLSWDKFGVPRARAATWRDAMLACGFLHGQERLFQMDLARRAAAGRLSELFGGVALGADRSARRRLVRPAAEEALSRLGPEEHELLRAYATGVNAAVEAARALPPEYAVIRTGFEPWRPLDSLLVLELVQERLSASSQELTRWRLARRVGLAAASFLLDGHLAGDTVILGAESAGAEIASAERSRELLEREAAELELSIEAPIRTSSAGPEGAADRSLSGSSLPPGIAQLPPFPEASVGGVGSNSWVVDGTLAESGAPLLANDTHLQIETPALFYLLDLEWPGERVAGVSIPGLPGVVIGRNGRLAWGITALAADTIDYVLERVDPGDPSRYLVGEAGPGRSLPFESRDEEILVRGGEKVTETVRVTRHGAVIDPAWGPGVVLARAAVEWPEANELAGMLGLMTAADFESFRAAAGRFGRPALNFVYADTGGHVGYVAAGAFPHRVDRSGLLPAAGWQRDRLFDGWDSFTDRPGALDPPAHFLVTANNRVMAGPRADEWNRSWIRADRAWQATHLLAATSSHRLDTFRAMQLDTGQRQTALILDALERARTAGLWAVEPGSDAGRCWRILTDWDRRFSGGPAPGLYSLFWRELLRLVFADEIGEDLAAASEVGLMRLLGAGRFVEAVPLATALRPWWDDVTTPEAESRSERTTLALASAWREMMQRSGPDPDRWSWPHLHHVSFVHPLGRNRALGRLFNGPVVPLPGAADCLLAYAFSTGEAFSVVAGPVMRLLVDLSPRGETRAVISLGQSGLPPSPHYDDQARLWAEGESLRLTFDEPASTGEAAAEMRLEPAP